MVEYVCILTWMFLFCASLTVGFIYALQIEKRDADCVFRRLWASAAQKYALHTVAACADAVTGQRPISKPLRVRVGSTTLPKKKRKWMLPLRRMARCQLIAKRDNETAVPFNSFPMSRNTNFRGPNPDNFARVLFRSVDVDERTRRTSNTHTDTTRARRVGEWVRGSGGASEPGPTQACRR